jgi:transcriptional regulator with XRE-family HTH domain
VSPSDRLQLLREKCDAAANGQAEVARRLGYSPAAVCQVLNGNYKGNTDRLLAKVEEVYGSSLVECPGLGQPLTLGQCAAYRQRSFAAINPEWVRMSKACRACNQITHDSQHNNRRK